jgi:undecaprenyl pyrophosphate phosphatase UppP
MNIGDSLLLGISQSATYAFSMPNIAPPVSISLMRGYSESAIASFPLIMSIPAMFFSNLYNYHNIAIPIEIEGASWLIPLGIIAAALFGALSIKLLQWLIRDDYLHIFAKYNAIIGGLVLILGLVEYILGTTFFELFGQVLDIFK